MKKSIKGNWNLTPEEKKRILELLKPYWHVYSFFSDTHTNMKGQKFVYYRTGGYYLASRFDTDQKPNSILDPPTTLQRDLEEMIRLAINEYHRHLIVRCEVYFTPEEITVEWDSNGNAITPYKKKDPYRMCGFRIKIRN